MFKDCINFTIQEEGGFVDNPHDPGGATNMGITISTLSKSRGYKCTTVDVEELTLAEAVGIYLTDYWTPMRCSNMMPGVDLMCFDEAVNAGVSASSKILQQALNIHVDGIIGPATLEAMKIVDSELLINKLYDYQIAYYKSLSSFHYFGDAWINRTTRRKKAAINMPVGV